MNVILNISRLAISVPKFWNNFQILSLLKNGVTVFVVYALLPLVIKPDISEIK